MLGCCSRISAGSSVQYHRRRHCQVLICCGFVAYALDSYCDSTDQDDATKDTSWGDIASLVSAFLCWCLGCSATTHMPGRRSLPRLTEMETTEEGKADCCALLTGSGV